MNWAILWVTTDSSLIWLSGKSKYILLKLPNRINFFLNRDGIGRSYETYPHGLLYKLPQIIISLHFGHLSVLILHTFIVVVTSQSLILVFQINLINFRG